MLFCLNMMCKIRVSEEPWSLWALMEKRCKNSCKMSNEGCKMTTKWHKMTATWQHSSAKQSEGDRKAAPNYQKNNKPGFWSQHGSCLRQAPSLILWAAPSSSSRAHFPIMHVKGGGRACPLSSLMFTPVPALEDGALWHKAEQILTIRRPVNRREAGHRSAVQQVIVPPPLHHHSHPHHHWFIHKPWCSQPQALSQGSCVTAEKRHPQENTGMRRTQRATLPQPPGQVASVLHHLCSCLSSLHTTGSDSWKVILKSWKDDSNNNSDTPCPHFSNCLVICTWICWWSFGGFVSSLKKKKMHSCGIPDSFPQAQFTTHVATRM